MTNKGEYGFMEKSPEGLAWIKRLFSDPTKHIVFHNAKFDLKLFSFEGIDIFDMQATAHCTLILTKMYNGMYFSYKLEDLGAKLLGRDTRDKTEVTDWLKANGRKFRKEHGRAPGFHDAPRDVVKRRCLWDVETTILLYHFLKPRVDKACPDLYETERQLMFVVVDMETTGIMVDITRAKLLRAQAKAGVAQLKRELNALICPLVITGARCTTKGCKKKKNIKRPILKDSDVPECCPVCGGEVVLYEETITDFNPNSTAIQMPAAFTKLGMELKYKTKPKKGKKGKKSTGGGRWCFDEYAMIRYSHQAVASIIRDSGEEGWTLEQYYDALKQAKQEHKLPMSAIFTAMVLKMNEMNKLISTYYDHIIDESVDVHRDPSGREVGTLHAKFNQSEAMTGRFSSSGPNLQNMPRILGPRECFITRPGRRWWMIDYEQVEMKFFAHFAEDDFMAKAIAEDIHLAVAAEIYHLTREQVSSEQRKRAKGVNFGIVYGSGAATMAETLTKKGLITSVAEAAILVAAYHRRFPSVRRATNKLKIELNRRGYLTNPFGRRYHIAKKKAYIGLNYECQGTSADLMKQRMVRVWLWLRKMGYKTKIILQVHDELGFEMPRNEEHIIPQLIEMMEDRESFRVPITVDAKCVKNRWSKKYKPKEVGVNLAA